MGRRSFTRAEIEELRRLIREKQTADRDRQKVLRGKMRRLGFYITDFASDYGGFVLSDLDDLISRGLITISDAAGGDSVGETEMPGRAAPLVPGPARARAQRGVRAQTAGASAPAGLDALVRSAGQALTAAAARRISEEGVPRQPGLYAIHGTAAVWLELGLGEPPDERPLYVGKAEASLVARDIDTHFGDGRTGSSTVRRSFAALLHEPLELEGRPRNPATPERPANYGLAPEHDQTLTAWMRDRLALAVWPTPADCEIALGEIESALLQKLKPPLNVSGVVTPWTAQVKAARKVMADEARRWM